MRHSLKIISMKKPILLKPSLTSFNNSKSLVSP
jgi:hypothetical protein